MKTTEIIKQLNSATKIIIICHLLNDKNGITISELENKTKFQRTNISKQMCEMKCIGLVKVESIGRHNYYFLTDELYEEQKIMIMSAVNSYHIIDEGKTNHKLYK